MTVHAELFEPHDDLIANELAHLASPEVGPRIAPRRGSAEVVVEEDATEIVLAPAVELPDIHVVRAPMRMHDVVQHREAVRVRVIDELLEFVGTAVRTLHRKLVRRVVAP
jgi:hypothetical protein